jgi:hypothetical protein
MFTQDNTTGYTQNELDELNAELARRLEGFDYPETIEIEKQFSDEVSKR